MRVARWRRAAARGRAVGAGGGAGRARGAGGAPGLVARAEVLLRPRPERDLPALVVAVRERERERRRAADHLAVEVVLRAVARALVLERGDVPRHDAAEVRAHGVDREVGERVVLLHDQVVRVALEALDELARRVRHVLDPLRDVHLVAERVLREQPAAAAAAARRHEEVDEAAAQPAHRQRRARHQHEVHHVAALHVGHEAAGRRHADERRARLSRGGARGLRGQFGGGSTAPTGQQPAPRPSSPAPCRCAESP